MFKDKFNSPTKLDQDTLLEDCLFEAFNEIVSAKVPGDAPRFFVRCFETTRFNKNVTALQILYTSANAGGIGRGMEQNIIENMSDFLQEEGFRTSFDQNGMEILLETEDNGISRFCEFAILLHPDRHQKLASRIRALQQGMPAEHLALN